ncbi:MAG: DUF378 domain-containing protein [Burkholderiales bacterium]|nr:DUF378 domain-containing protein [Burkholderiales bacterium]
MKKFIQFIILALALSGALNWGLIALLDIDVVVMSFGENTFITRLVYLLISIANFYLLLHPDIGGHIYQLRKRVQKKATHDISTKQIIAQNFPLVKEQEKFISKGGNSQSLENDDT